MRTELTALKLQLMNFNIQLTSLNQIQNDIEDRRKTLQRQMDRIQQSPDYVEEEEGDEEEEEE